MKDLNKTSVSFSDHAILMFTFKTCRAVLPGQLPLRLPQRDVQPRGAEAARHRQLQGGSWIMGHPQTAQVGVIIFSLSISTQFLRQDETLIVPCGEIAVCYSSSKITRRDNKNKKSCKYY